MSRRIMLVDWVDAVHQFGWRDGLQANRGVSQVQSVGYLMVEDEQAIVLAQSVAEDSHAQTIEIPRGMIRAVRHLELPV